MPFDDRRPIRNRTPRWARGAEVARAMAPQQAIGYASIGYGAGGPTFSDAFRSKRAPTPTELVDSYKAVAYACVQLNVKGVARVPLRLYATTGAGQQRPGRGLRSISRSVPRDRDQYLRQIAPSISRAVGTNVAGGEVTEIVEHPYLEALKRPNPFFDGWSFLAYLASCLDVIGSAYFVPVRPDPTWASSEWWPLQSQYVYPIKGSGGPILSHYQFFSEQLGPDEVERCRFLSLRDPYLSGYAPLQACFEQVGLGNYYTAVCESMLKNGARPSGLFTPRDAQFSPGEAERKRFEWDVRSGFSGGKSGYLAVTNGAYAFQPIDWPPSDLSGLEITKNMRLIVANCFDVPISLLQTEDSNRAVAEAGNYQHQRNAIEPRCILIAAALTAMAQRVDPRLFFAFDCPVEQDQEKRQKIVDMRIKNGTLTINEARAESGDEPVEGGDEPLVLSTLKPLSLVLEPPAPPPQLAPGGKPQPETGTEPDGDEGKPAKGTQSPQDEPDGDEPDEETTDEERSLLGRLGGVLTLLERSLATQDPRNPDGGPDDLHRGAPDPAEPEPGPGASEHVWAADRDADHEGTEAVVSDAAEGGPGAGSDAGGGPAEDVPAADGLRRPDGAGDDAATGGLLVGERQEGDEPAGPGPGPVGGDEPAPEKQDRDGQPGVLRVDEPDDEPAAQ